MNLTDQKLNHTYLENPLVLVAEDHEDSRLMLKTMLELRGIRVVEAADGETAVNLAASKRPDLILMDGKLEQLDGISALKLIRASDGIYDVPVVIVSGSADENFREAAFAAGCNDFLAKPLNYHDFYQLLKRHLRSTTFDNLGAAA